AKRIESGREILISSLCENKVVMKQMLQWRDELGAGTILLREIIELDSSFGATAVDDMVVSAEIAGNSEAELAINPQPAKVALNEDTAINKDEDDLTIENVLLDDEEELDDEDTPISLIALE
ncbi:MAG: hypothetical protein ACKO96_15270, partial [Flammeovirgaceae bacterium]